ncbi:hypothetical protein CK203_050939 [Vitis vinifera]|uniref:Uncharacterized protein n=1 Tax=Vitis vinifera TaxID=29760 RepID=A0A438H306_VITVI|nr:hypothetical protein CK203_050939 [Vitis vinifera]
MVRGHVKLGGLEGYDSGRVVDGSEKALTLGLGVNGGRPGDTSTLRAGCMSLNLGLRKEAHCKLNKEAVLGRGCLGLRKDGAVNNSLVHEFGGLSLPQCSILRDWASSSSKGPKGCLSPSHVKGDHDEGCEKASLCSKEVKKATFLDLSLSLNVLDGTRLGFKDDSRLLLVRSSLNLEERVPSVDATLLLEVGLGGGIPRESAQGFQDGEPRMVGLEARSGFFVFMRGLRVVVSGGQVAMFGVFRFSKALG